AAVRAAGGSAPGGRPGAADQPVPGRWPVPCPLVVPPLDPARMKPLCLLLLPDAAGQPAAWWRLHDGQSAHGQLLPDESLPPGPAGEQVVVATVGAQVGVHWASLDAHTPAQARVAAASTLAPQLIPPAAGLHIAACRDGQHWQ